jgi:hypothetical protein
MNQLTNQKAKLGCRFFWFKIKILLFVEIKKKLFSKKTQIQKKQYICGLKRKTAKKKKTIQSNEERFE